MQLIPDWRQAWRFNSVQLAAILFGLSLIQSDVLPYVQPLVPAKYWPYVTCAIAVVIVVFRILQQELAATSPAQAAPDPQTPPEPQK